MGAESFVHTVEASTPQEAFKKLYEQEGYERGYGSYNGSITTCNMGRCTKTFSKYNKKNEKETYDYIDSIDFGRKWYADYIDLGIKEYACMTVTKQSSASTSKYIQKYVVCIGVDGETETSKRYDNKTDADKEAMRLTLLGETTCVKKKPVKISGNDTVTTFDIKTEHRIKPLASKPNMSVKPIHVYVFYGFASC